MADNGGAALAAEDLRRLARGCWAQARPQAALEAAWQAFDRAPGERATKRLLVDLLRQYPAELSADRRAAFLALLTDREVEPDHLNAAGWHLVLRENPTSDAEMLAVLAERLERDELALALLREAPVGLALAERLIARVRRWLLLSGQWRGRPALVAALHAQAALNGGAWPFDVNESERFEDLANRGMAAAYLPVRPTRHAAELNAADPVTRAVAAQYEAWPYPAWTRITLSEPKRLADTIRALDDDAAAALPDEAKILIAGCGTGREAAVVAQNYPDAIVTAIDVSEASLDYGRRRCSELGIAGVRFRKLDLHAAPALNEKFHAVYCSGVLHHLPDPERGLRVLADVLQPGGVMRIMVYSRVARLRVAGARKLIGDLMQEPVSDELLRQVRRRLLEQPEHPLATYAMRSRDFATLAGTHDLLLHRHEDPLDIPRLQRALENAGLRVLSFRLPTPPIAARYDAMFPGDPRHRDIGSLARFEMSKGGQFLGNYNIWCCKSPSQTRLSA